MSFLEVMETAEAHERIGKTRLLTKFHVGTKSIELISDGPGADPQSVLVVPKDDIPAITEFFVTLSDYIKKPAKSEKARQV